MHDIYSSNGYIGENKYYRRLKTTFIMMIVRHLTLFTLTVVYAVSAQTPAALKLQTDYSRFRGYDNTTYVEVYYAFDVSSLTYQQKGESYQSEAVASITFKRSSDDSVIARQAWRIPFSVHDLSVVHDSRSYVDVAGFIVVPDIYRVYIVTFDMNNPAIRDSISLLMDLQPVPTTKVALSDVELANSIVPAERDSANRFYKNTFEVKPNPGRLYGEHQPVLFYYLEAYNLKGLSEKTSDFYHTKAVVTNSVGKEVVSHEKPKKRVNESNVEVGLIKVNTLRSGSYTFTYTVIDSAEKMQVSSSKKFFVYNPSLPIDTLVSPSDGNIDATEYATMTEEDLDKEFEQSRYVAMSNEIDRYKKLKGAESKRKALFEFWSARDQEKATPINETKQEYFRRVAYADNQYRTGFREGWKADRGRVYIVYGPPDEIERHANELDVKPYEIWYYNSIQGGVQFVFGDRTGFSDYILLHSTHRNELRDDNWMRQIQSN
jgi:GWxTD domain-containing protein